MLMNEAINNKPLFSVLIANFNNVKTIDNAIDSVFQQTFKNWEIVIVDDGSTDNSCDIYKKYEQDSRFKIFYNKKNRGCGYTKSQCVELAEGDLCGFLDADDALSKNALEIMVNLHKNKP
jgi:glycosyltransferase involved in cell wall biosynthesis